MLKAAFAALAIAFLATATGAYAASKKDVARVVDMIADKKISVISRSSERVVFVHRGMRYTFWHSGERIKSDDPNSSWLSVWVRKDGTSGQESMDAFSDNGFDGKVDFGIDGSKKKIFETGADGSKPEGLGYQAFWQEKYDAAISAAVRYSKGHSK